MKFYYRISELAERKRIEKLSFSDHSRLMDVTGRRNVYIHNEINAFRSLLFI